MREEAEQVWPAFWMPAFTRKGTARSRSASAKTIWADLPPSSSVTGTAFFAAAACTISPVRTEPVKEMWLTSGCSESAAPASEPKPVTMLSAPDGKPSSSAMRANSRIVRHASSAGLTTAALPMASAAPRLRPRICIG
ncbi:hypothetical protein D9M72_524250 [compost metagenome]